MTGQQSSCNSCKHEIKKRIEKKQKSISPIESILALYSISLQFSHNQHQHLINIYSSFISRSLAFIFARDYICNRHAVFANTIKKRIPKTQKSVLQIFELTSILVSSIFPHKYATDQLTTPTTLRRESQAAWNKPHLERAMMRFTTKARR